MAVELLRDVLQESGDSYDVFDGGRRLGRIFRHGEEFPWQWHLSSAIANPPKRGRADSRAKAVEGLLAAYHEAISQP